MDGPTFRLSPALVWQWLSFVFAGVFLAIALIWMANTWLSAPNWATVEGRIVQAGVTTDTRTHYGTGRYSRSRSYEVLRYSPDVVYHYRVGERDFTGFGIGDGADWSYSSVEAAAAAVAPYRGRGSVTVYYDPATPEHSCLDTSLFGIVPWLFGGVGLLFVCIGLWLRASRRTEEEDEAEDAAWD
jgi:hypothetical protein